MASPENQTTGGAGADFGANSWLVEEMYEQFVRDPGSVGEQWQEFFADYKTTAPSVAAAAAASPAVRAVEAAHRPPVNDAGELPSPGSAPAGSAPAPA
ncbi:MAG: hypothetical protein WA964_22295, partial [Ilumatobacter sp.]|uniref:2-oxoglutarate dehydrogenase E1 subunit family protein n=1 Tax=Ilumatobacter sp. TaxID=1967498 RepID=UPI003C780611